MSDSVWAEGQPDPTPEVARQCIQSAIERIEAAILAWKRIEADPASDSAARSEARLLVGRIEEEFAWQWRNVRLLLKEGKL